MRVSFRAILIGLVLVLAALGAPAALDYWRGAALVADVADVGGMAGAMAAWQRQAYADSALALPTRHGTVRARLYTPERPARRAAVLVPGLHGEGIDERRLVGFARHLAARGLAVVTPELTDLMQYRLSPRSTDVIEDAALWTAGRHDLARDGRIGVMGISFGGGLSMVAAGRPPLRGRVAFTLSLGGHGDLPRVLRYLCTGVLPDGSRRPPHDYGVVIILLNAAPLVVPAEQVEPLRTAILRFLLASQVDMTDKPRAREIFAEARALETALPEPASTLMGHVNMRNVAALGPILLPHLAATEAADPALSPEKSPPPAAPVYLLHGSDDNVIPAMESAILGDHLAPVVPVRLLVSPLITHAELDRASQVPDVWRLVAFWANVLDE